MTFNCLVCMSTPEGCGFAEVRVNSLHQLAVVMPAPVVSYEIRSQVECPGSAQVVDAELFDVLVSVVQDIKCQWASDHCAHHKHDGSSTK